VSIPTLGGPPCIDDDIDGDDMAGGVDIEEMMALQNDLYPGTSFGLAFVDEQDM
jgi:hypothetical protein